MKKLIGIFVTTIFTLSVVSQNHPGNALSYSNSSSVCYASPDLKLQDEITVMAWVKWSIAPEKGNSNACIVSYSSRSNSTEGIFWLRNNPKNNKFQFTIGIEKSNGNIKTKSVNSTTEPVAGIWYQITGVYDGQMIRIYINGKEENKAKLIGKLPSKSSEFLMYTGKTAYHNNNFSCYEGTIDDVSVWNKALSKKSINKYGDFNLSGKEPGILAYYNFNESKSSKVIYDQTRNGFHGINGDHGSASMADIVPSTAPCSVLYPKELLHFTVKFGSGNNVELSWATSSETNNHYFTLYRSEDLKTWQFVANISGSGNSKSIRHYKYKDQTLDTQSCYYKLRKTNYSGEYTEYNIVPFYSVSDNSQFKLYPGSTTLGISFNYESKVEALIPIIINLFNEKGQIVYSHTYLPKHGKNNLELDLTGIQKGNYFMQVVQGKDYLYTAPLIKK